MRRPRTALHLIDTGGPGGAETVFCGLATRLHGKPLDSLTVVPRAGWLSARLEAAGLAPTILESRGALNLSYLANIVRLALLRNVRLIHAHLLGSAVYGALAGSVLRVPVIAVFHGPTDVQAPGRMSGLKRWLLRHRCSRIVAVSDSTRAALIGFGVDERSVTLIKNGVDVGAFFPNRSLDLRTELGLRSHDILIGAVGNIRAPKAYEVLLHAAQLVVKRLPNAHFAVIGTGDEPTFRELLRLRDSLELGARFHFLGFRKADRTLLGDFDLFVSSSRSEGLPLSFLEAMACQLCVVATKSGGAQEVVEDGGNGLLVPIENPVALADAIETASCNPELRQRLGVAAREKVIKEFDLGKTMSMYETLYAELLGQVD